MKTFLKLIAAVSVFGFATANAVGTYSDLAAAKAAVAAAVTKASTSNSDSDIESLKTIIANAVAQFPDNAGDIITSALTAPSATLPIKIICVRVATWTAPDKVDAIIMSIQDNAGSDAATLTAVARRAANAAKAAGTGRPGMPPITLS